MIKAVVYETDSRIAEILAEILSGSSGINSPQRLSSWSELRKSISLHEVSVVVLGPESRDQELDQVLKLTRDYPGTSFVHVVDDLDPATLQKAMRNGIRDVVALADAETELAAAVVRAHGMAQSELGATDGEVRAKGKVVSVLGVKGGTGKTMLATNLAVQAARSGVSTALIDACLRFGDCAAVLRVRPEHTAADLSRAVTVDESLVNSLMSTHDSGLHILCAPSDPMASDGVEPRMFAQAINMLKRSHDLIVIDTGPSLDEFSLAAFEASDITYLITSLELPAVKDAKLTLSMLDRSRSGEGQVKVVLNRANTKVGFPPDEVARALGRRAVIELPSDIAVPRSINNGVVVTDESPRSKIGKSLAKLVADMKAELLGAATSRERKSMLRVHRTRMVES